MDKSPDAFRTISEVADWLKTPAHVLRFWESRFSQVKPVKRAGGRRYYRPSDMALLGGIKKLLHEDGMTIRGAQKLLRENGVRYVSAMSPAIDGVAPVAAPAVQKPINDSSLADSPYLVPANQRTNELDDIPAHDNVPPAPMAENVPTGAFDTPSSSANTPNPSAPPQSVVAFTHPNVPEIPQIEISSSVLDDTNDSIGDPQLPSLSNDLASADEELDMIDSAELLAADHTAVGDVPTEHGATEISAPLATPQPTFEFNEPSPTDVSVSPTIDDAPVAATDPAQLPLTEPLPVESETNLTPEFVHTLTPIADQHGQQPAQAPVEPDTTIDFMPELASEHIEATEDLTFETSQEQTPQDLLPFALNSIDISHIPMDYDDDSSDIDVPSGILGRLAALSGVDPQALQPIIERTVSLHAKLSGG